MSVSLRLPAERAGRGKGRGVGRERHGVGRGLPRGVGRRWAGGRGRRAVGRGQQKGFEEQRSEMHSIATTSAGLRKIHQC